MRRVLVLEIQPDQAELLLRGLKRLMSYLKMTDNGSVSKADEIRETKELIRQLEGFIK